MRERDRDSGLSIVRISKNGVLTIEDNRLEDDGNRWEVLDVLGRDCCRKKVRRSGREGALSRIEDAQRTRLEWRLIG